MVFMVVTMIFLLLWPTLASAMSGYDANVGAYIPDENQNFVPFNNFTRLLYIVHDGERIKISNDSVVTDYDYASNWHSDPVLPLTTNNCYYTRSSTNPGRGCEMQNTISAYVKEYGLGGTKNISSVFNKSSEGEIDLPAPILNISKFYSDDDTLGGYNDGNQLPMAWFRDNKRYELQYIEENGTCQNIGVSSCTSIRFQSLTTSCRTINGVFHFCNSSSPYSCYGYGQSECMSCGYVHILQ
jgi:hypothetical protein